MALQTRLSNATANAQANALARLLDNGYLRIYSGSQPANADTAVGSQVLLAELRFAATSAPSAVNGVLTFNAITSDSSANATGSAAWFRAVGADGTAVVLDGSVGVTGSGNNLELSTVSIAENALVSITSFTHTVAKATTGL
jgi:hypothetical protein